MAEDHNNERPGKVNVNSDEDRRLRQPCRGNHLDLWGPGGLAAIAAMLILASIDNRFLVNVVQAQQFSAANLPQALVAPVRKLIEPLANTYKVKGSGPDTLDIIKQRGFIGERYRVRSRYDGQPLIVYHIINPLADPTKLHKYPVLVSHGIAGDSSQMVARSGKSRPRVPVPGQVQFDVTGDDNTAFTLSNNNFDVWLRDARGVQLTDHDADADFNIVKGANYWNFSLDEQAQFDVPTEIDFVLEQTQTNKLHYIGFSESTSMIFMLLSWQPHYQAKLASVITMAPIAYLYRATGGVVASMLPLLFAPDNIGLDFMPQPLIDSVGYNFNTICSLPIFAETICKNFEGAFFGFGTKTDSADYQATQFKQTSIKAFKQFVQFLVQRRFGMYDYGTRGNIAKYGSPLPPNYNLRNIITPRLVLLRGGVDFLSRVPDQQRLINELGTKPYLDILLPEYNHLDFLVSKTLLRDVTMPIVKVIFQHLFELNPSGNIFRDSQQSRSPAFNPLARPPEAVARPDGTTNALEQKSVMMQNIVHGVFGENPSESAYVDKTNGFVSRQPGITALDPIKNVVKSVVPVKALDGYAKIVDKFIGIPGHLLKKFL